MVDGTSMCICPCGSSSTTSKKTSVSYHLTSGAISTSSTSDKGCPLFYNVTTNAGGVPTLIALNHGPWSMVICIETRFSKHPLWYQECSANAWNVMGIHYLFPFLQSFVRK